MSVHSRIRTAALAAGTLVTLACGGGGSDNATGPVILPPPSQVASFTVVLGKATLFPGSATQTIATVRDAAGNPLFYPAVSWSSSAPVVARVDSIGMVTAYAPVTAAIIATSQGRTGEAIITALAPIGPVVTVYASSATVVHGAWCGARRGSA